VNFSRGRAHEYQATGGPSPAGVVRVLYKALIGVLTGFFLVYAAVDLLRWRRER
jgi:NhaP-type Na+/H+ or K+/H+ antiporter